jgi:phosphonate transport system substrate-binding protein
MPDGNQLTGLTMRYGRNLFAVFLAVLLCGVMPSAQAQHKSPLPERSGDAAGTGGRTLQLGIVPFSSTTALLRVHQPLRGYLMRTLDREVTIYTSRDHGHFLDDALDNYFDIVITTAHFLPMLAEGGFVPLVRYRNPFDLLLVVKKESKIQSSGDLRGHHIGLPDRLSLFHIAGMQWLEATGMKAGVDYALSEHASHTDGMLAVDDGRIDAIITGRPPWLQLDAEVRGRLRLVEAEGGERLPAMMTLARPGLGEDMVEKVRAALLAFPGSPEGQAFFAAAGYGGYVAPVPADIEAGRVYEPLVRRLWTPRQKGAGALPKKAPPRTVGYE